MNERMTTAEALDLFDGLETVAVDEMIGRWRGEGVDTGHYLDGMLEAARWHGKRFDSPEDGHPLVHRGVSGGTFCLNPALLPIRLCAALPARDRIFPVLMPILAPFLSTSNPKSRLRMTEYRGKVSATMIYDAKPINDVFRRIDAQTLMGVMDFRGDADPFIFKLTREG